MLIWLLFILGAAAYRHFAAGVTVTITFTVSWKGILLGGIRDQKGSTIPETLGGGRGIACTPWWDTRMEVME